MSHPIPAVSYLNYQFHQKNRRCLYTTPSIVNREFGEMVGPTPYHPRDEILDKFIACHRLTLVAISILIVLSITPCYAFALSEDYSSLESTDSFDGNANDIAGSDEIGRAH